jgi:hypothetical protein
VSPKRLDHVAPPSVGNEWHVRFGTSDAASDWNDHCEHARTNTRQAFDLMRTNPRPPQDENHYRLRGDLATRELRGKTLEQWQIKVSSGGRIWYLPDDDDHTVWVVYASPAHPKPTDT